ncbi:hypothetical protein ACOMHN_023386 [Nucella lapillus]
MKGVSNVLLLAVLASFGRQSLSSSRAPLENPFPLGTIGCLASDVCGPGEVCKDDLLFGSCQDVYGVHRSGGEGGGSSQYGHRGDTFRLRSPEIAQLEQTIWNLIRDGFTWQDAYTQCTLQNLLVAFQRGSGFFSPRLCEEALGVSLPGSPQWGGEANAEIASVLQQLLRGSSKEENSFDTPLLPSEPSSSYSSSFSSYPRIGQLVKDGIEEERVLMGEPEVKQGEGYLGAEQEDPSGYRDYGSMELLDSNKRDEFVQVHKYFDKSKGQLKRDPFLGRGEMDPYNFLLAFPQQAVEVQGGDLPSQQDDRMDLPPAFPDLPEYPAQEVSEEGGFFELPPVQDEGLSGMEGSMRDEGAPAPMELAPEAEDVDRGEEGEGDEGALSLSPEDEVTLGKLLQGSLEPDDLPVEQQRRLSRIIEVMLSTMDMRGNKHLSDIQVIDPQPQDLPPAEHNPIATQEAASRSSAAEEEEQEENDDHSAIESPEEEEAEGGEDGRGGEGEEEQKVGGEGGEGVDKEEEEEEEGDEKGKNVELDKKSPLTPDEADSSSDHKADKAVVKTGYTYIKLNNKISEKEAEKFLQNLSSIIHAPSDVASLDQVNGDQLILKLNPDSVWNSSKLAREAGDHGDALYQDTGLKVVDAGVGKGVTVEVKKKEDGREVVLTFILVGSIAGVVLAVIIIYLFKRHRRSRDKLAQLATSGDGNEASKDYQDLCRQRMQSKASEKPEPLHAASRIGSVSESQVRSPSSRSSTSSWSEEPAATNMDISTGHVVLAYMEDHLKNGDRLQQEWEALAAYQADPCSTAIANDTSNTRKNRYSDVLPYDHSRVVLSAKTNVSNSDYINANFITDHDPRNPAYICTQGPLPHTVADFWQMVWEQGSVVIVMLTKLTENGTAMCHRYWPEEGSDLYHIYEVHLVSEHIWCDDYLVRSFYLKNLQTNETRTVTQFHFLTWPHLHIPPSMKALLDFRRKVNKSFRGGSCPIVLHCNDGCGRSGTYCLMDMVLNRMAKGAKEIDIAATLEHLRDQRMNMVQTQEQFQFALSAIADEVHAILKSLPQ